MNKKKIKNLIFFRIFYSINIIRFSCNKDNKQHRMYIHSYKVMQFLFNHHLMALIIKSFNFQIRPTNSRLFRKHYRQEISNNLKKDISHKERINLQ